jgi:hypothetical protein
MRHRQQRLAASFAVASLVLSVLAGTPASASNDHASPRDEARLSSPALIERAVAEGRLSRSRADRYLAYALAAPARVPAAYRSSVPFHGTALLLELRERAATMRAGSDRAEVRRLLAPDPGSFCDVLSPSPLPDNIQTAHFYIEYSAAALTASPDGLDINDYADSLEHSWQQEITRFRWWAPPVFSTPPPGGKYHVRIEPTMAPVLYGFVSSVGKYAGPVGNNPYSPWNDKDADASCMGLNNDYSNFPGTPRRALDATTAHEFNHSIQFGVGGLSGPSLPDSVFIEGGATWMEDEAYDSSNDNYNYLWPTFEDDMGEYEDSPYPYWITFRGLTERYGTAVAGGGEDVMQRFWEYTSRDSASNLAALNRALQAEGTSLRNAYHAYAVAVKFNAACGGGYVYPYCLEEGPQYVNGDGTQTGAGPTEPHGQIDAVGGSLSGQIPDNYALNWVLLPGSGAYRVILRNTSAGGSFRMSLACDTGSAIRVRTPAGQAGPGQTINVDTYATAGCAGRPVAVVTNLSQTASNPASSTSRTYTLQVRAAR